MSRAYYNENDAYCAAWLRELIRAGHIAAGDVDERSIEDVTPSDLAGYTQCHFFAGIGVWSYALRLAGWPDDRAVWTGSCPCQPFSAAGKGGGVADERHLWPAWFHLIELCRPPVVFGEQVASKDGLGWLDTVHADMESADYAVGAADLCAAGVGAPHIRQRLYFVGHANNNNGGGWHSRGLLGAESSAERSVRRVADGVELASAVGDVEYPTSDGRQQRRPEPSGRSVERGCSESELGNADKQQRDGGGYERPPGRREFADASTHWSDCDWLPCTDGKARPVEPGTFPLAHGAPARVGRLRAYGNAIVAPLAQAFIES